LALKLKKKLNEVTLALQSEKEDSKKMASEKLELLDKIQNLSSVAKNTQVSFCSILLYFRKVSTY
jgi:hypothetical protein